MDEDFKLPVSPRHSVRLASEYMTLVRKPQRRDFVVRTLARREASGMPLMSAEIVIAGQETRAEHPLAKTFPLHFRKTYFPGRLHGDPKDEFDHHDEASRLIGVPAPIGYGPAVFRACLIPGKTFVSMSSFQREPEERNLNAARELELSAAVGQWKLAEQALELMSRLHAGGLAHGDAELQNFIVCPSPLEILPIDFEASVKQTSLDQEAWQARLVLDLDPLLRHAVLLQCSLGPQPGALAERSLARIDKLFKRPDAFRSAIDQQVDL